MTVGYPISGLKSCAPNEDRKQLTPPPIEPDMSMQNITMELSSPWQLAAVVAGAGLIMYVTSGSVGISSARMSTAFCWSQNSHCQICRRTHIQYQFNNLHYWKHQVHYRTVITTVSELVTCCWWTCISRSLLVVHIWKEFVQSVLESIYGGSLHNVRSKAIPVIDYCLGEEVLSDIQSAWLFVYPELVSS